MNGPPGAPGREGPEPRGPGHLSARRWKALAVRVAERSAGCGSVPSVEARVVLLGILARFGRGEDLPAQAAFAAELGLSGRTLQRRLGELSELGLVCLVQRGSRPAGYEIDVPALRRWCAGEDLATPDWRTSSANLAEQTGDCGVDSGGAARVRASRPSSSAPSAPDRQPFNEAIAALQWWGFRTSAPGFKAIVAGWLEEFSPQDIAWAAEQALRHGAPKVAYAESALRSLQVDRAGERARSGEVVDLAGYRSLHPWGGTG